MIKKVTISKTTKGVKMNCKRIEKANFAKLLKNNQIGPNGRSAEWLRLAQSDELISTLDQKGSSEYFKKLKSKLASKGFYKELLK